METQGIARATLSSVPVPKKLQEAFLRRFCETAREVTAKHVGDRMCIRVCTAISEVFSALNLSHYLLPVGLATGFPDVRGGTVFIGFQDWQLRALGAPPQEPGPGWNGHLVIVVTLKDGSRWLVDPTYDQTINQLNAAGWEISWPRRIEAERLACDAPLNDATTSFHIVQTQLEDKRKFQLIWAYSGNIEYLHQIPNTRSEELTKDLFQHALAVLHDLDLGQSVR